MESFLVVQPLHAMPPGVLLSACLCVAVAMYPREAQRLLAFAELSLRIELLNLRLYLIQRVMHRKLTALAKELGLPAPGPFKFVRLQERGQ